MYDDHLIFERPADKGNIKFLSWKTPFDETDTFLD